MKPRYLWLVSLLICSCDRADGKSIADEAIKAPPIQPLIKSSIPSYYPSGYAEIKAAATIFAEENFGRFERTEVEDDHTGDKGVLYLIEDCQGWAENAEIRDVSNERTINLEYLARYVAKHQHFMRQLYPAAVYGEPLKDYERAKIALIQETPPPKPADGDYQSAVYRRYNEWEERDWKLQLALVDAIEARRRQLAPNSVPVRLGGGCGAFEEPYVVRAQPPNGRIWMTTKFSWDLCRARKLDPWNTDECRWTEVSSDKETYLSGRYVYQAKWPGGAVRRGLRAFEHYNQTRTGIIITRP